MRNHHKIFFYATAFILEAFFVNSTNAKSYKNIRRHHFLELQDTQFVEPTFIQQVEGINGEIDNGRPLGRVIRATRNHNIDGDGPHVDQDADYHHHGESSEMEEEEESALDNATEATIISENMSINGTESEEEVSLGVTSVPTEGQFDLPKGYNKLVIPRLHCKEKWEKFGYQEMCNTFPVALFIEIKRIVHGINEALGTLTLDLDLKLQWIDGFVKEHSYKNLSEHYGNNFVTLDPIFLNRMWIPDIFIDEMTQVRRTSLLNKPLKFRFSPKMGFVLYETRLRVHLGCEMTYEYYPADTQSCGFNIRSYSHSIDDLRLLWLDHGVFLRDPYDPNFDLQVGTTRNDKLNLTDWNDKIISFDILKFTILARRKLSFHMVQTYLPSVFFIVITWLCFLVPPDMVEGRIGISMTTLLTLTSMFDSVREHSPHVSYVKAIDIWMVSCIFFIFMTLLEFITLVWLRRRRKILEEQQTSPKLQRHKEKKEDDCESGRSHSLIEVITLKKYERAAEFTEKYAFLIFSTGFMVFNIIYWSWLLTASNYFGWKMNSTLNHQEGGARVSI